MKCSTLLLQNDLNCPVCDNSTISRQSDNPFQRLNLRQNSNSNGFGFTVIKYLFISGFLLEFIIAFIPSRGQGFINSRVEVVFFNRSELWYTVAQMDIALCLVFIELAVFTDRKLIFTVGALVGLITRVYFLFVEGTTYFKNLDIGTTDFYAYAINLAMLLQCLGFLYYKKNKEII
jgi:hypothetical protein